MQDAPRKAPLTCPKCGFVQQESVHVISTCCRSCGHYYDARVASATKATPPPQRSAPRVLRSVTCYHCRETHDVSSHAQSTICPGCNASIGFGDLTFSTNVSRPVDTRGKLIIAAGGNLNTTLAVCGDATIWGKISGTLHCEGTLRLHTSGKMSCRMSAQSVVIEKGTKIEFVHPVATAHLDVHGGISGRFVCSGQVHVWKDGQLDGRLEARSVVVEKGGFLVADCSVNPISDGE